MTIDRRIQGKAPGEGAAREAVERFWSFPQAFLI
jgi:hypothetical protein